MKILITGNMGYLGPAVVQQLRASYPQATIIGYDLGLFASNLTNTSFLPECRLHVQHFGDVRHFPGYLLSDIDTVVHLAAVSNDPMANRYEDVTMAINFKASIKLAALAKEAGVKSFIFASSCSIYGFSEQGYTTEKSPPNPLTAYARSKLLTEEALENLAAKNFKITCLRFATACGMSERLRLDLVLNDFVASAVALNKIILLSSGTAWRALIDVKDIARAIDWAINRELSAGGDYVVLNVGADKWNYRIMDLAEAVAAIFPALEISIDSRALPDKRSYRVDFSLFKTLAPAYQPQYDLFTTVKNLVDGLNAMGFNDRDFRRSHLVRLNTLELFLKKGLLSDQLYWNF